MIKVILKPEKGIQIDSTKKYLFDPSIVQQYVDASEENAVKAENSAKEAQQVFDDLVVYTDNAKADINNKIEQGKSDIEDTKNTAISTIDSTVAQAKSDINTAVSNAESTISTIVSDAEGSITTIAVTEANKAIANAAQEATDTAKANVNSYVDGTVKPSLQTYVDQAQEKANSAATSMEQAALSATAASNYASNASADAGNAAESAGLASNSAAEAKLSENNAKAWAEGTDSEVTALGGVHSSKVWSEAAQAVVDGKQDIANLSQTLDNSTTKYPSNKAVKTAIDAKDSLPDQTGNADKFLKTDGTTASWAEIQLSNPFVLFESKWSADTITNASWLISNGTFHSGATYVTAYQALVVENNSSIAAGTTVTLPNGKSYTKRGLSVKLSTEAYTDYDFVLNNANTTFRLPIKVKLASGNAVAGNGMTLGLTDGTNNAGLQAYVAGGNTYTWATQQQYGTNIGTTSVNSAIKGKTLGVTTDPTKSGIETSSSGLKLYFYVGETIQDANVINAAGVLTRVANCIDRTVASDRETVVGWGMPDYSAATTITNATLYTGFTATEAGRVIVSGSRTSGSGYNLLVNGVICAKVGYITNGLTTTIFADYDKGDVVSISNNSINSFYGIKIPFKGVK